MGKFVDFDEVREKYPILEVAQRLLNAQLKQETETKYRGQCPFCNDPRSFRITTDAGSHGKGMAGCFKCGPKGDVIALIAKKHGMKANDAAAYIEEHMRKGTVPTPEPVPTVPGNSSDKLEKVAARLQHEHEEVQALGLTPETAHALGIGFVKSGTLGAGVIFPLYRNGQLTGYMRYSPDEGLRFPNDIVPRANVLKFPKAG